MHMHTHTHARARVGTQASVARSARHHVQFSVLVNVPVMVKSEGIVDKMQIPSLALQVQRRAEENGRSGEWEPFFDLKVGGGKGPCRVACFFFVRRARD